MFTFNMLLPALVAGGHHFTVLFIYPFIERWITGDKREHHILDRPRNAPTRTAIGAAGFTCYASCGRRQAPTSSPRTSTCR